MSYPKRAMGSNELKVGDTCTPFRPNESMYHYPFNWCVVTKVEELSVHLFRPYAVVDDHGLGIPYIGHEHYSDARTDDRLYFVYSRTASE